LDYLSEHVAISGDIMPDTKAEIGIGIWFRVVYKDYQLGMQRIGIDLLDHFV
jgi:hypothetical protein